MLWFNCMRAIAYGHTDLNVNGCVMTGSLYIYKFLVCWWLDFVCFPAANYTMIGSFMNGGAHSGDALKSVVPDIQQYWNTHGDGKLVIYSLCRKGKQDQQNNNKTRTTKRKKTNLTHEENTILSGRDGRTSPAQHSAPSRLKSGICDGPWIHIWITIRNNSGVREQK